MSLGERVEQMAQSPSVIVWAFGSVIAFFWWVARTVLTNKARVDAIERKTDEIHKDVREIRSVLLKGRDE